MLRHICSYIWLCCMNRPEAAVVPCTQLSADRRGRRTTAFPPPIAQRARQRSFPLLRGLPLRPPAASKRPVISGKGLRSVTLSVVTRRPFPCTPTFALERYNRAITLRRGGRYRGTQHGICPRRDDDAGSQGMLLHSSVSRAVVVEPVPDAARDFPFALRPPIRHLGRGLGPGHPSPQTR